MNYSCSSVQWRPSIHVQEASHLRFWPFYSVPVCYSTTLRQFLLGFITTFSLLNKNLPSWRRRPNCKQHGSENSTILNNSCNMSVNLKVKAFSKHWDLCEKELLWLLYWLSSLCMMPLWCGIKFHLCFITGSKTLYHIAAAFSTAGGSDTLPKSVPSVPTELGNTALTHLPKIMARVIFWQNWYFFLPKSSP